MQKIGRYILSGSLGKGAMGLVVRAHDPTFHREVALKVLHRKYADDPVIRQRFLREAQSLAALEHPAVVPVYDYGVDGQYVFLVMRLMEGESLADRLARGSLSVEEMVTVLERIGSALDVAHALGIVHRDVKPGNILYDNYGQPYLADFGIARMVNRGGTLTLNHYVGTPFYMSPEQFRPQSRVDGRSDLYALGVVLFEMVTGEVPRHQHPATGMVLPVATAPEIPALTGYNRALAPLQRVVERAMAREPAQRYQSGRELAEAAGQVLKSSDRARIRPGIVAGAVAAGAGAVLLFVLALWLFWPQPGEPVWREEVVVVWQETEATRRGESGGESADITCLRPDGYRYTLSAAQWPPAAISGAWAGVGWQAENTGCPLAVVAARPLRGGEDREVRLYDSTGMPLERIESGDTGWVVLESAENGESFREDEDEWVLVVRDQHNRLFSLFDHGRLRWESGPESEPLPEQSEPTLMAAATTFNTATPSPAAREMAAAATPVPAAPASPRPATRTPDWNATSAARIPRPAATPTPNWNATLTVRAAWPTATPTPNWHATLTVQARQTVQMYQTVQARPTATRIVLPTPIPTTTPTMLILPTFTPVPVVRTSAITNLHGYRGQTRIDLCLRGNYSATFRYPTWVYWNWQGELLAGEYLEVRIGPPGGTLWTQGRAMYTESTHIPLNNFHPRHGEHQGDRVWRYEWQVFHMAADQRTVIGESARSCFYVFE